MSLGLLKCIVELERSLCQKKKLKLNIIYNSASQVVRTHVFTSAEIELLALRHRLKN